MINGNKQTEMSRVFLLFGRPGIFRRPVDATTFSRKKWWWIHKILSGEAKGNGLRSEMLPRPTPKLRTSSIVVGRSPDPPPRRMKGSLTYRDPRRPLALSSAATDRWADVTLGPKFERRRPRARSGQPRRGPEAAGWW